MSRRMKRWLIALPVAAVLVSVVAFLLRPDPVAVEVAAVERRDLAVTVDEEGRTRGRDPYVIAAPISGRLLRPEFNEGDRVIKGQILGRIALPPENRRTQAMLEANLAAARARHDMVSAELAEAESALQRARSEAQRRRRLAEEELISTEESETFAQQLASAEARVSMLNASLRAAEAEIESVRSQLIGVGNDSQQHVQNIYSPSDGTIYRVHEDNERVVAAGTPLLEVSNRDALEIVVDLLTQEAVRVEAGDLMLIRGWGGDETLEARVRYIEPEAFTKISALGVEEQRVNVIADFIDQPDALGAEYRIEASIVTASHENTLTIPSSAIFQRGNGWNAFVVENGNAVLRQVDIGARNQQYAQVLGSLEEGDTVIVFPSDLIEDGVAVTY